MFDMVIIGGGMAGLSAAIYARRYSINYLIVGQKIGGLLMEIHEIYNYPGHSKISGEQLTKNLLESIDKEKIRYKEAVRIEKNQDYFTIILENDETIETKTVIIATGTHKKHLNLNEREYIGRGVSYCATCDAPLFKDKNVVVYGGANSAAYSAMVLLEYAKTVTLVYRGEKFKIADGILKRLKDKNVTFITKRNIQKLEGDKFLKKIILDDGSELMAEGLFVNIGSVPTTDMLNDLNIKHDEKGFIIVDEKMKTNVRGVFAAGDVVHKDFRQLVTAASDGSIAAYSAYLMLSSQD